MFLSDEWNYPSHVFSACAQAIRMTCLHFFVRPEKRGTEPANCPYVASSRERILQPFPGPEFFWRVHWEHLMWKMFYRRECISNPKKQDAPASLATAGGGRWSSKRKVCVTLEHLRGKDLESTSQKHRVTAATLTEWRARFVAGGEAGLKSREVDVEDEEKRRLKSVAFFENAIGRAGGLPDSAR
jgi:hypothetical protein